VSSLTQALKPLAWDFLPTIVFAGLTAAHVDVTTATAVALAVGVAELIVVSARGQRIELLQWAGLGLALVFGAASLLTHDPRFIMVKPTIIYSAIGVVMMKRGWMVRYTPERRREIVAPLMTAWGYAWAGLMFLTAAANLIVAIWVSKQWPLFMAVVPLGSKLVLFAIQYLAIRAVVVARLNAESQVQAVALAA